jgi:hypothetical protein
MTAAMTRLRKGRALKTRPVQSIQGFEGVAAAGCAAVFIGNPSLGS